MSNQKAFDTLLQPVPELKAYDNAVKRFKIDPESGKMMFSLCINNYVKGQQLLEKIKNMESKIDYSDMDYVDLVRKRYAEK
jgi:hypothetical protein